MDSRRERQCTQIATLVVGMELFASFLVVSGQQLTNFTPPQGLCFGRCLSRCADERNFREANAASADEDTQYDRYCSSICSPDTADEWIATCKHDECHKACTSQSNDSAEDTTFSTYYTSYPSLRLESISPAVLRLTWRPAANDVTDTVLYAVITKLSHDEWKIIKWTTNTTFDVCTAGLFHVAYVNRFGTVGLSGEKKIDDLPKPGAIKIIQQDNAVEFNGEYFEYSFKFSLPAGWKDTDLGDFVATSHGKLCKSTAVPPLPIFNIRLTEETGVYQVTVLVHHLGFGCRFFSMVKAVSTCSVRGYPYNFTIDLADCANITGYPCPITYEPLGAVRNVSVTVQPGVDWVSVTWLPQSHPRHVYHYIVEYGILQRIKAFVIRRKLKEAARVIMPEDARSVKLRVMKFGVEYGVKILAVTSNMDANETERHLWKMYPVAQFIVPAPVLQIAESMDMNRQDRQSYMALYVMLPLTGIVLVTLVSFLALMRHHRHSLSHKQLALADNHDVTYKAFALQKQVEGCMTKNPLYPPLRLDHEIYRDNWEISYDNLTFTEVIGSGAFGQVVKGTLCHAKYELRSSSRTSPTAKGRTTSSITVAIKVLPDHSDESERRDFLKEIDLMKSIGSHPNVVGMIGCCTALPQRVCLVVEHMPGGDLLHYLRSHRHSAYKVPEKHLSSHNLFSFARQVAVGMEFLSQKGFVHRDLACRNILVSDANTVKIGDFGLTRYIYDDKVYVTRRPGTKLPLKWMALESIMDLTFTTASDVWAFGVVLFELTTLGGTPYPTISNRHLLKELQTGFRMERPDNCPPSLYAMMLDCWQENPCSRPTFTSLRQQLDVIIEDHSTASYIHFDLTVNGTTCGGHDSDSDSDENRQDETSNELVEGSGLVRPVARTSSVPQLSPGRLGDCSEFSATSTSARSSDYLLAPGSTSTQSSRLLSP